MDNSIFAGIQLILVGIIAIVGYLASNYLQKRMGADAYAQYYNVALMVVQGMEQAMQTSAGQAKKEAALQELTRLLGNKLTKEQLSTLIESAVFEMNKFLKPVAVPEVIYVDEPYEDEEEEAEGDEDTTPDIIPAPAKGQTPTPNKIPSEAEEEATVTTL
jgi:LL-H family phage holin